VFAVSAAQALGKRPNYYDIINVEYFMEGFCMFNLMAFLSYVVVVVFTPGPNTIMSMVNASRFGFRKTLRFITGAAAGFFIIILLSGYFNLLLFNLLPKVKIFMGILGAVYMTYLAVVIMKNKDVSVGENKKDSLEKDINLNSFYTGLTMQFINPKVILFGITVMSNFIIPYFKSSMALIGFSFLLALVAMSATTSWALFGSIFKRFLSNYRKQFNIAMGLLLIYSAVSISGILKLFR
jgi:threonine/homoserine/homoserine lactone efflux protein